MSAQPSRVGLAPHSAALSRLVTSSQRCRPVLACLALSSVDSLCRQTTGTPESTAPPSSDAADPPRRQSSPRPTDLERHSTSQDGKGDLRD